MLKSIVQLIKIKHNINWIIRGGKKWFSRNVALAFDRELLFIPPLYTCIALNSFSHIMSSLHYTPLLFASLHFFSLLPTSHHFTALQPTSSITAVFTSVHITTLHRTSIHFITLHLTPLLFPSLHFIPLLFSLLQFIPLHLMSSLPKTLQ